MEKLIAFRNDKIQIQPFGWLGAFLLLLVVFGVSTGIGIVYMVLNETVFKGMPIGQSICMNVGSMCGDLITLIVLYNMYAFQSNPDKLKRFIRKQCYVLDASPDSEAVKEAVDRVLRNPFSGYMNINKALPLIVLIICLVLSYRLGYDSLFAVWLEKTFPMDDSFMKAFENIFAVPLLGIFSVAIFAPIYEEIVFRGFIVNGLRRKGYSIVATVLTSAFLFALIHMNILQGVNAFIIGIFLALIYEWTNDLRYCIALHLINNTIAIFAEPLVTWMGSIPFAAKAGITLAGIAMVFFMLNSIYKYAMENSSIEKPC